VAYKLFIMIE